jgi:hypothetical protein
MASSFLEAILEAIAHGRARFRQNLTAFLLCSYAAGMWTRADDLRLSVVMGLRDGLGRIRGMRRSLTEDEQHKVADAIVQHLESTNWKIEKGPPAEGHGQYLIPPR